MDVDTINKLAKELIRGNPTSATTEEEKKFVEEFKVDMARAEKNGWDIELPFEIEVGDDEGEA